MQINRLWGLIFIILIIINSSCIEEYQVKLDKYENSLVVEGLITNLPEPYVVRLSTTSSLNSVENIPLVGAEVFISDNIGDSVMLFELEAGSYVTEDEDFIGVVGLKYKLTIAYNDKRYATDYIELKEPLDIKTVNSKIEERDIDVYPYKSFGYQFFVSPAESAFDSTYLYFKMIETYEYNSDFPIDFVYDHNIDSIVPYPEPMEYFTCWKTNLVPRIVVHEEIKQAGKKSIGEISLHYIDNTTRKFSVRYSVLVQQLRIDAETYLFLKKLEEQNDNEGSLYTTQPFQIVGNVYNKDNRNERVLGSFIVAGASEKRVFRDRPVGVPFHYSVCLPDYDGMNHLSTFQPPVYISREDNGKATGSPPCFDCRLKGGTVNKPDFWID